MEKLFPPLYMVYLTMISCNDVRFGSAKLVDLTHLFEEGMLYIPFFVPFQFDIMYRGPVTDGNGTFAWNEFNKLTTPEHIGTHLDAPSHFSKTPDNWRLHEIPIERFIGDAVVIDISNRSDLIKNPDNKLLVSDLVGWEENYGRIPDGSIVFVYTGWDQYWGDKEKYMGSLGNDTSEYHWPGIGKEAAEWIVENRPISGIGTDTMAFDSGDNLDNGVAHITILSARMYGLENLNNLGLLPPVGARAYVFPMNIYDGSGAPCRVIAEFGVSEKYNHSSTLTPLFSLIVMLIIGLFVLG